MKLAIATELEFDKVQQLVAAQARSGLGRRLVTTHANLPDITTTAHLTRMTSAVWHLMDEDGALSFAGLDEALPWLEPDAPAPAEPGDLLCLLTLARRIAAVRRRLVATDGEGNVLESLAEQLPDTSELVATVAPKLGRDGTISDDATPELRRLRQQAARVRQQLLSQLEDIRRAHPNVVTDAPPTLRRERYCLPVRASSRSQLPGLLLDTSSRGATAFVEPFAAVDLNNELAEAAARERDEIRRIVAEIAAAFLAVREDLAQSTEIMATLDAAQARAIFGRLVEGRVVEPRAGDDLVLMAARHPLLDERLHALRSEIFGESEQRDPSHRVVPLDFSLPRGVRTLVISGPNAGGKTVTLKTVGLMVLMAAHGIPVPVDQGTTIPSFDRVWCHIGDEQDVSADLSSFSGAMTATARLLADGDAGTLVLYDELGAGTDPLEGAALGLALLEELTRRGHLTVATTHLAPIALNASATDGMDNAAMGYDEAGERPTYRLTVGRPGRSRAVEIARRTGIPDSILDRAAELLGGEHLELERWLRRLEELEAELENQRSELDRREHDVARHLDELERDKERLEEDRAKAAADAAAERDRLRRRAKEQLDDAIQRLDRAIAEHDRLGKRRRQRLREEALDLGERPHVHTGTAQHTPSIGARVRLTGIGGTGVLEEVRGNRVLVTAAGKRLWVELDEIEELSEASTTSKRPSVEVDAEPTSDGELILLGLDSEQAREELEKFLDRALTVGTPSVRVVHGHGTGVLRRMVTEVCRSHPAVRSFEHPPRHLGGTGATEITLDI